MPYFDKVTKPRLASMLEKIQGKAYTRVADLDVVLWHSPEPLSFERRFEGKQRRLGEGETWGNLFDCAWFRFEGTVPHQARDCSVVLLIDISGEALIVDAIGNPARGLTTFTAKYDKINGWPGKKVFPLQRGSAGAPRAARGRGELRVAASGHRAHGLPGRVRHGILSVDRRRAVAGGHAGTPRQRGAASEDTRIPPGRPFDEG